jgi:PIN domain nuclease of toxin-antitoxin system
MNRFVTDTHPLVWHLTGKPKLSPSAKKVFAETDAGLYQILIPGIVLIEMVYLSEKDILPATLFHQTLDLLDTPNGSYAVAPLDQAVARIMVDRVPWSAVSELADRIVTATAISLHLPLITKDKRITASNLTPILW